ncbi:MAG: SUMF1/EgtB/PvdO family nonheme iron enzyme, partial [Candidatus Omnitrophica bacterium]|nr:SUMF1/EgtB/PvdO family nonheme iron enzyme [Candidatus Omnitrophota bacterium]
MPSEAEWEYASRAGGRHQYCGSDTIDSVAWYGSNGGDATHRAGTKSANGFGLHDLSGNVWEWVQDCRNASYAVAPGDGRAWESGDCVGRVLRGGSWINSPQFTRSANRHGFQA